MLFRSRGYNLADILTEESFKKLSNKLVFSSVNEMMASVGYGAVSVNQIIFKLIDYYKKEIPKPIDVLSNDKLKNTPASTVVIKDMGGLLVRFAHCCNPVPGDDIVGFVSRGRGVIVHRKDCPNLQGEDPERLQPAKWTGEGADFIAGIKILAEDNDGLTAFIVAEISALHIHMTAINGRVNRDGQAEIELKIKLNRRSDMDLLINRLKRDKRVIDVYRTTN